MHLSGGSILPKGRERPLAFRWQFLSEHFERRHPYDASRIFTRNARRFVDLFIRQNSARTAADDIRQIDHEVVVKHTPAEKALYLQKENALQYQAARGRGARGAGELGAGELQKREQLLMLSSFFAVKAGEDGEFAGSATDQVGRVMEQRQKAFAASMKKLDLLFKQLECCRRLLLKTANGGLEYADPMSKQYDLKEGVGNDLKSVIWEDKHHTFLAATLKEKLRYFLPRDDEKNSEWKNATFTKAPGEVGAGAAIETFDLQP